MASSTPQDENTLVLYQPQGFDVVMKDAPELAVSAIRVEHPPDAVRDLHNRLREAYETVRTMATNVTKNHRQGLAQVRAQYDAMVQSYNTMGQMYQAGVVLTTQQIAAFKHQVEQASSAFSRDIWGHIARFAKNDDHRQQAVDKMEEITRHHSAALDALTTEVNQQRATQHITSWAHEKDSQINNLLARKVMDPSQFDELSKTRYEELRQYTQTVVNEFREQRAINPRVDADSILDNISRRAASQQPESSAFVTNPVQSRPPSKYSSTEGRMRERLSNRSIQRAQAKRQADQARVQFEFARAGPFMSDGLGGGPPPPPRRPAMPGYPDDDSGPDDSDGNGPPRGPPNPIRRPRRNSATPEDDQLLRILDRLSRPTPAQINPIHLNKPPTYDGKDLSKFRPWWMKVESYIETYAESFLSDQHRINWVGSLLSDKAQSWHQQRVNQVKKMRFVDTWTGYVAALHERFRDPSERHRNAKKMFELKYAGDTAQYLTELLDLNEAVQWSGTTFQNHISKALPDEITKLVYSRQGAIPDTDEDFLACIQEAGQIYENMMTNPGISSGKGAPTSRPEHSKSGHTPKERRSSSDQGPSSRPGKAKVPNKSDQKWAGNKEALLGIAQEDIDKRKKAKAACWRCGRDNHQTLNCFARKDVDGKDLPQPKVSALKRKKSDDYDDVAPETESAPPKQKKARIDGITITEPFEFEEARIFEVNSDDLSGSETGFH